MNLQSNIIITSLLLISFHTLFVSEAYAYLDPGTGTMFLQMIAGVLIGLGITLKIYWQKIKYTFSNILKK
jgi:hypothetical protein